MTQRPVAFFGQAGTAAPREGALDRPASGVGAEIGFPHPHPHRFLDPDAVALDLVLAENAVNGTVHKNDLDGPRQYVRVTAPSSHTPAPFRRVERGVS